MSKRLRNILLLVAAHLIGLALIGLWFSDQPPGPESLRQSASQFWQQQKDGRWHASWQHFSAEALARLRAGDPETFKDADHYASQRARWALKNPYAEVDILKVEVDPERGLGNVTVGLRIRGKTGRRQIVQAWRWDGDAKRWLIDATPTPEIDHTP